MPRNVDPSTINKGSGMANQNSVDANAFMDEVIEGQTKGLDAHINDAAGAHDASSISTTTSDGQYDTGDVQGNLDELAALIPTRPPTIGNFNTLLTFSGIPDWGSMKLVDAGQIVRGNITPPGTGSPIIDPSFLNTDGILYPYYWTEDEVASDPSPFSENSNDPITDPTFNVVDGGYDGGGDGLTHQGGFTRATIAPLVIETTRILNSNTPTPVPVVVSNALYPSDRGVVALFFWPADGDVAAFLAVPLGDRVVAAILCGQGILDGCDGDPGGIFEEGDPDIFAFPGRTSGQFDLVELHTGLNNQTGTPLPAGPQPAAGQVRLGTDPNAGPVIAGGIPIIGATTAATGGGNDDNFFRYRVPYLEDLSSATGLEHTPAVERPRYFEKPTVSLNPGTDLTQAGDFQDFGKNYWNYQLARFRHRFVFPTGAPAGFQEDNTYILIHFKREQDFEAFARDGVMPDDGVAGYELWSSGLVNYTNPESTDNLTDNTVTPPVTSLGYHSLRAAIFEDDNPLPTAATATYAFIVTTDEVMFVSGVQYFVPGDIGVKWSMTDLDLLVDDMFENSYLLGSNAPSPAEITPGLDHRYPLFAYLGMGTAENNITSPGVPAFDGSVQVQRVEFRYDEIDLPSGPYSLISGPAPADQAEILISSGGGDPALIFGGDGATCHFWQDARVRGFGRTPAGHQTVADTSQEFLFTRPGGGELILFHTTGQSPTASPAGAVFGNFRTGGIGTPVRAQLETVFKDSNEIFLDEVYRIGATLFDGLDPTFNGVIGNLVGPALPFPSAPIEIPVRFASDAGANFGFASFLQNGLEALDLAIAAPVAPEAQVGGFPDRNPPLSEGVDGPLPRTGILKYPKDDYTTGFRPSVGDGDITSPQFDYSPILGDKIYLRVLDLGFSNEAALVDRRPEIAGQPFVLLYLRGLGLADIAYAGGPGPGGLGVSVEIRVPGLTTWLDLGRIDGAGPGKQDPIQDGAGCQRITPNTIDFLWPSSGEQSCQIDVSVGPVANFFLTTGAGLSVGVTPLNVSPLLVRITLKDTVPGRALDFTQAGVNGVTASARGMCAIGAVPKNGLFPAP